MRVPKPTERPLLIVDGDNLAHRAYHSMPKSLRSADGKRPINAIVGWTNMLVTLWENERPRSVYVAWDTLVFGCLSHNRYENNVSRITENVLRRFASAAPLDPVPMTGES